MSATEVPGDTLEGLALELDAALRREEKLLAKLEGCGCMTAAAVCQATGEAKRRWRSANTAETHGCEFGCGPDTSGQYVKPGFALIPACPVHGWVCQLLDARDALARIDSLTVDRATEPVTRGPVSGAGRNT